MTKLENCPFCGAGEAMIYEVDGTDIMRTGEVFKRPELFCDGCKTSVYVEDNSSTGRNEEEDYQKLQKALYENWNKRA